MSEQEMTDEQALIELEKAIKGNVGVSDDKQSLHQFLHNVATAEVTTKVGNLRDDKDLNELGNPVHHVRASLEMARICDKIIENEYLRDYFLAEAEETLATSLSRNGFLVIQATTQTKKVADITRRRKINRGMFGRQKIEETGGEPINN